MTDSSIPDVPVFADALPLLERARLGCLPDVLHIEQIATLEYPDNPTWRLAFAHYLQAECEAGKLPHSKEQQYDDAWIKDPKGYFWWSKKSELDLCEGPSQSIHRSHYREWLIQQNKSLPEWWFPTTAQSEPDKPEQGMAGNQNPAMSRQCITDKARFLEKAKWEGTQQATVDQHPEAAYFKGEYYAPTLLRWASEIDPRPTNKRGGRPRKS